MDREQVKKSLLGSGLWPFIRQRPYSIIADPKDTPKSIFISAFDTSPLAPDYDFIVQGNENEFLAGIDALSKLTDGKIHLNINADLVQRKITKICEIFQSQNGKQWFEEETFRSLMRIRGIESNSQSNYAEAFYCRKIVV